jgi:phage shock protein E
MLNKIGEMLGLKPEADFNELMKRGAQVVDVRSRQEFDSGHLKGSINIPLQELSKSKTRINKSKPVIVCCASGMRSASAKSLLRAEGFEVYNGGGWQSLLRKLN